MVFIGERDRQNRITRAARDLPKQPTQEQVKEAAARHSVEAGEVQARHSDINPQPWEQQDKISPQLGKPPERLAEEPKQVKYYRTTRGTKTFRVGGAAPPTGAVEISKQEFEVKPSAAPPKPEQPTVQFSEKAFELYKEREPEIQKIREAEQPKPLSDIESARQFYKTGKLQVYGQTTVEFVKEPPPKPEKPEPSKMVTRELSEALFGISAFRSGAVVKELGIGVRSTITSVKERPLETAITAAGLVAVTAISPPVGIAVGTGLVGFSLGEKIVRGVPAGKAVVRTTGEVLPFAAVGIGARANPKLVPKGMVTAFRTTTKPPSSKPIRIFGTSRQIKALESFSTSVITKARQSKLFANIKIARAKGFLEDITFPIRGKVSQAQFQIGKGIQKIKTTASILGEKAQVLRFKLEEGPIRKIKLSTAMKVQRLKDIRSDLSFKALEFDLKTKRILDRDIFRLKSVSGIAGERIGVLGTRLLRKPKLFARMKLERIKGVGEDISFKAMELGTRARIELDKFTFATRSLAGRPREQLGIVGAKIQKGPLRTAQLFRSMKVFRGQALISELKTKAFVTKIKVSRAISGVAFKAKSQLGIPFEKLRVTRARLDEGIFRKIRLSANIKVQRLKDIRSELSLKAFVFETKTGKVLRRDIFKFKSLAGRPREQFDIISTRALKYARIKKIGIETNIESLLFKARDLIVGRLFPTKRIPAADLNKIIPPPTFSLGRFQFIPIPPKRTVQRFPRTKVDIFPKTPEQFVKGIRRRFLPFPRRGLIKESEIIELTKTKEFDPDKTINIALRRVKELTKGKQIQRFKTVFGEVEIERPIPIKIDPFKAQPLPPKQKSTRIDIADSLGRAQQLKPPRIKQVSRPPRLKQVIKQPRLRPPLTQTRIKPRFKINFMSPKIREDTKSIIASAQRRMANRFSLIKPRFNVEPIQNIVPKVQQKVASIPQPQYPVPGWTVMPAITHIPKIRTETGYRMDYPPPPLPPPPVPVLPPFPSRRDEPKLKWGKVPQRFLRYQHSLVAAAERITGKQPQYLTGLEVRPVVF